MSLRDIYSNNESNNASGNISLHTEPQGNGSGLDNFHTVNPEEREPNNTGKIVGALAVALMVGAAGIGLYASSGSSNTAKPMMSASNAPALPPASAVPPAAPAQQAAMATPADANTPASSSSMDAAPAPVKSADAAPASTKTADAAPVKTRKSTRTAKADTSTDNMASSLNGDKSQTVVPSQTAAAEPVSPIPSPNDVASNSTQSSVAVQPNATSASDIPAPQPQQQANTATPVAPEVAQPTVQAPAEQAPAAPAPATEAAPAAQAAPAPAQ